MSEQTDTIEAVSQPNAFDVIDYYGDRQICDQCGATVSSYGDKCNARLDVRCQGFETYDMMLATVTALRIERGKEH